MTTKKPTSEEKPAPEETPTPEETTAAAAVPERRLEGGAVKTEADGAPKGYTYRLLTQDVKDVGPRGKIVLVALKGPALPKGSFKIPTADEIKRGVL